MLSYNELSNAMMFGVAPPSTAQHFAEKAHVIASSIPTMYQNTFGGIVDSVKRMASTDYYDLAQRVVAKVKTTWHGDVIRPLENVHELQTATPKMQKYIMANPYYRELYHKQLVDGYSEEYVDCEPDAIGEEHRDYRTVMDGVMVVDDDGNWECTMYDDIGYDEVEMSLEEKDAVLRTWDSVEFYSRHTKRDIGSVWNQYR